MEPESLLETSQRTRVWLGHLAHLATHADQDSGNLPASLSPEQYLSNGSDVLAGALQDAQKILEAYVNLYRASPELMRRLLGRSEPRVLECAYEELRVPKNASAIDVCRRVEIGLSSFFDVPQIFQEGLLQAWNEHGLRPWEEYLFVDPVLEIVRVEDAAEEVYRMSWRLPLVPLPQASDHTTLFRLTPRTTALTAKRFSREGRTIDGKDFVEEADWLIFNPQDPGSCFVKSAEEVEDHYEVREFSAADYASFMRPQGEPA